MIRFENFLCSFIILWCYVMFCRNPTSVVGGKTEVGRTTSQNSNALSNVSFCMPDETSPHEATWLQWPHHYEYGRNYQSSLEPTWLSMTNELLKSENVYIIVYNKQQHERLLRKLRENNIPLKHEQNTIKFFIHPYEDVWIRDNGPIFVRSNNTNGASNVQPTIIDFGFNGWGKKHSFAMSDKIPAKIGTQINQTVINLNKEFVVEGGAFEVDGHGTLLATRSSIINRNRNPKLTEKQIESYLAKYIGISKFIWLDGVPGLDITDMHIDGFARFGNPTTIVTMKKQDLLYWEVPEKDIDTLLDNLTSVNGDPYTYVYLPLTRNEVRTTRGKNIESKGSYVNFYTANTVILVPQYEDPNDKVATDILQALYPKHRVAGINVQNLFENGGMIHCVTQQQPLFNE
jgi:agmatine deiminase